MPRPVPSVLVLLQLLLLAACGWRQAPLQPVFPATRFGVACDGVADDAPAIQRALDAAGAAGGATVRLPQGTCRLASAAADGSMLEIKGATRLQGAGTGRTVLRVTGAWFGAPVTNMIYTERGASGVVIEDLTLDFNARENRGRFATTGLYGLAVRSSDTVARRVEVVDSPANGIGVPVAGTRVRFEDCRPHDNRLNGFYAGEVSDIEIVGCEAFGNTNGISLANGSRRVVIAGNRLHHQRADGVSIGDTAPQSHRTDTREVIIAGNRIEDNARAGIALIASRNRGASPSLQTVVHDNDLLRNAAVAISCNSAQDVRITFNRLEDNADTGVLILNGREIAVYGNTIAGSRLAIRIADNPHGPRPGEIGRISIVGNRFGRSGGLARGLPAVTIDLDALTDRVIVADNRIDRPDAITTVDPGADPGQLVRAGNGP
ncbi:MAG TPA: right-handed parallel beta-helix repeat-containing protein [Candidatus Polarisedimenticolaceae bacterium]|nr:right-handed parallel beta-helix repeat-containing protein [Candidatus Polarisedimenticolaceae bacterium]